MDLVASCKDKLPYFRIKELKEVLTRLGLSKQGKKQDLIDRILAILSDEQVSKILARKQSITKEEVARLVDDTYRKMQSSAATDLSSIGNEAGDSSNDKFEREADDPYCSDTKIRCLCGSSLRTESMIECDDMKCRVWQHISCVMIPEKPVESLFLPEFFYCEICRLSRVDPFWLTVAHPLLPVKLTATNIPNDGTDPVQSVEKTFQLTRADKDLLAKPDYDVQAWCMLLNDNVPFRMQWLQYANLQVNGVPVRVVNRPGSQLLGSNGRDDGPIITQCTKDGINKICLTGCDARIFCFGVRIVKQRTLQQVLNYIPKESDGELFEQALSRVCRCIGGNQTDNADSDSDLEVIADFFSVNLRCPMSGSRMKVAGRFKPCAHMGCFDLEVFVEMNQRSRKWQCPSCLKNYSLEHVIIDPYFNRITTMMRHCGEDTTEIEVKPDGCWRVKAKSESERWDLGSLAQWHFPTGTLCTVADSESRRKVEAMKQVKQECYSEGYTGFMLGVGENHDGVLEVSIPENMNGSCTNKLKDKLVSYDHNFIQMSSSATGSGRDGEDQSVNQGGAGNLIDISANNGIELASMSLNVETAHGCARQNSSGPSRDAEVIVLSDSDDDNDHLVSLGTSYKHNGRGGDVAAINCPLPAPEIVDSYADDSTIVGNMGIFSGNGNDFDMISTVLSLPNGTQSGPGLQLFDSDATANGLVDLPNGSINCPASMNGYTLAQDIALAPNMVPDSSIGRTDNGFNGDLVDNPLAFGRDDPPLQIFLPTRPSDVSAQSDMRNHADLLNGFRTEDWISLRLGDGANDANGVSVAANELASRQQTASKGPLDSLADTASFCFGASDARSEKASRLRSDSPFSFPRQKRSVLKRREKTCHMLRYDAK